MMYKPEAVEMLLNLMPRFIPVDEEFYLETNEDVREAVEKGVIRNGAQHFIEHGFFEDRLPMSIKIDEEDYLIRYPDVAEGVVAGKVKDATEHWLLFGRHEGRTAVLQATPLYPKRANPPEIGAAERNGSKKADRKMVETRR